jgi:hypothetical protein
MSIGCGATTSASNFSPSNPTSPSNPSNPATPSDPSPTSQLQITTTQLPDATSNSAYSAQLAATGGSAPYVWSASGSLPAGLTMSSTGVVSGTPTAAGQSMLTVNVKDTEQNPQTAQVTLALDVAAGVQTSTTTGQSSSKYFGPGINMISLNNYALNSAGEYVDYTFTAQQTGSISTLMPYFVDCKTETTTSCATGTGLYGGGDGAELQINVYPDNGSGAPDMAARPLGSVTPFWVCGGGPITEACRTQTNTFRKLSFEQPLSVVAGTQYHIVFRNIASNPSTNFSSLDGILSPTSLTCPGVASPAQPTFAPTQLGFLRSTNGGSTWGPGSGTVCNTPVLDLQYSNGFHQGNGYTMVGGFSATIGGSNDIVRELFTVGGSNKTVTGISVFVKLASGSEGLYAALDDSSGKVVAKGQATPGSGAFSFWRTYKFSSPVTLQAGQTYRLVLTATSTYTAQALENGSANGEPFSSETVWAATNAQAQFTTNGGATWNQWEPDPGGSNEIADLMFYFTLQ